MIFAISAAPAANPPKPNSAATSAITRNVTTHLNMVVVVLVQSFLAQGVPDHFERGSVSK